MAKGAKIVVRASYFLTDAGAFAMVYTDKGNILAMWFVPRDLEDPDEEA